MGCFKPEEGEASTIVLELTWTKKLDQKTYDAYKGEIKKIAAKYGARIVATELVSVEKKSKKMRGK
jgi:uncharacterized protein (DUF1330 family)